MYKYEYVNNVGNMSIRPTPYTSNTPIGSLPVNVTAYGDEVVVYPTGDKWVKISVPMVGYVAHIHGGKVYGKLTEVPSVPDPENPAYPSSFIQELPDGTRIEYVFSRVLP